MKNKLREVKSALSTPSNLSYMTNLVLFLLLACNLFILSIIDSHMSSIEANVLFDIDKARNTFYTESRFMFMRGCLQGTEYPEDWRKSQNEFNGHSTSAYCDDLATKSEDYLTHQLSGLGRK